MTTPDETPKGEQTEKEEEENRKKTDVKTETKQEEDPTLPYQYGMLGAYVTDIVSGRNEPFEARAFIEGVGIVLITNQRTSTEPTIKGEPKIREGNSMRTLPDKIIYFTMDTFRRLVPDKKNEVFCHKRNSRPSIPPPIDFRQKITHDNLDPILRKLK